MSERVRSAEKRRTSTCQFADLIAKRSITTFREKCPPGLLDSIKQTVVAAIILCYADKSPEDALKVVALGVGTKFLPDEILRGTGVNHDDRVRDMHAEVLAKRAFQAYIYHQIEIAHTDNAKKTGDSMFISAHDGRYRLRDGVTVHMYTSSQPCGNATIKRWAKGGTMVCGECGPLEWPRIEHARLNITARNQGQVSLACKGAPRHFDAKNGETTTTAAPPPREFTMAPGTAHPSQPGMSSIMTCSDKIARWNVLGLQGSLLATVILPIYLSSITIGRKFSDAHARRALCCRLHGIRGSGDFHLTHPAMLCTSVKLDESTISTAPALPGELATRAGATFDDSRCFFWAAAVAEDAGKCRRSVCCILDGLTGLPLVEEKEEEEEVEVVVEEALNSTTPTMPLREQGPCPISRSALSQCYRRYVTRHMAVKDRDGAEVGQGEGQDNTYRALKSRVSPSDYRLTQERMHTAPFFDEWRHSRAWR